MAWILHEQILYASSNCLFAKLNITNTALEWVDSRMNSSLCFIRFYWCFSVKLWSQMEHLCDFFPSWTDFMCFFKRSFFTNFKLQTSHACFFFPWWTLCDYKAVRHCDLKRHISSIHEGIKPLKCYIWGYENTEKRNLNRHVESAHEGIKPFKCDICDYKTALKGHLKTHRICSWRNETISMEHWWL